MATEGPSGTPAPSRVPELAGLRLLVAVARRGSIGGAARELGVTQQSASGRLRAIEAHMGLTLVQRGARGSRLTPDGVMVTDWAARLVEQVEEVDAAIEGLRGEGGRTLAVWASMTVAESLVPGWLVQLRRRQDRADGPRTTVSLTAANSREVVEAVLDDRARVGFVEGVAAPAGVRSRVVALDELVLVAAPGTRDARRRRALGPEEVAAMAGTCREPGSGTREVVVRALRAHGLTMPAPLTEVTTASAVRQAVLSGGAPAFVSRRFVARDLETGLLVAVPTAGLDLARAFRAVWVGSAQPPAGPVRELVAIARGLTPRA